MANTAKPSAGVRAIVLYKTAKASLQLAVVLVMALLWPLGLPQMIAELSTTLRHHVTQAWAVTLSAWLERGATRHGIELSMLALGLDGTMTGVEAWALSRARWWGPWLVVLATGSLLPFELYELLRVPRWSRALLIVLNATVVAYLAHGAYRHRGKRGAGPEEPLLPGS
jgi:uncharacterized membrane protein (DUF2068 family)